ncbi:hypothetical protein PFISCL1PPCAC_9302, partial [Pristionchus fissidentatus]
FLFTLISAVSALKCYVGFVQWGGPRRTIPSEFDVPNQYSLPKLTECSTRATCCSYVGSLPGETYECRTDCPKFHGQSEVMRKFPTDGFMAFCQSATGMCKYRF